MIGKDIFMTDVRPFSSTLEQASQRWDSFASLFTTPHGAEKQPEELPPEQDNSLASWLSGMSLDYHVTPQPPETTSLH